MLNTVTGYLNRKYPDNPTIQTVGNLMSHRYHELHETKVPYKLPPNDFGDYESYGSGERNGIKVKDEGGWFHRFARERGGHSNERLSLNVDVTRGLVDTLDQIMRDDTAGNIKSYKIPENFDLQSIRHDPVTIYFFNLTPDLAQKIAAAVQPFVRDDSKMPTIGIKIAPGVYQDKQVSQESIKELYDAYIAADLGGIGAEMITENMPSPLKNYLEMTAGQFYVWKQFLDEIRQDKDTIDPVSLQKYQNWKIKDYEVASAGKKYQKDYNNKQLSLDLSTAKIAAENYEYDYLRHVLSQNYLNIMKMGQIRQHKTKLDHFIFIPNYAIDEVRKYLAHFGLMFRFNKKNNVLESEDSTGIKLKLFQDLFNFQRTALANSNANVNV